MQTLTQDEIEELLKGQEDGVLAITDGESPYCIPMGYQYIDKSIYLSFFQIGRKWSYLLKNKKVCFNVYAWNGDRSVYRSVIIDGVLQRVTDIEEIKRVVEGNAKRFGLGETYLEKRTEYYRKTMENENALKLYKIIPEKIGSDKRRRVLGTSPLCKNKK